jgi:iron complex transport system substrate-binding protein
MIAALCEPLGSRPNPQASMHDSRPQKIRRRIALRVLAAALCAFGAAGGADAAAVPQRIASLNLCTDQLLLMLVPRARIASVTDWASRPESSYMAAAARGIPSNGGLVEAVLPEHPDLILAGPFSDVTLVHLLRRLGYRVEVLDIPQNLDEARAYILRFGELVGADVAARAMVANMDERLQRVAARNAVEPAPLAAVYAPNGMTVGRGTVLAEIVARAGWRNLGSERNVEGYGELSLEQLLVAQPRLVVLDVTAEDSGGGSLAHGYLEHPALASLRTTAKTVVMPPRLSECVGPMTVDAIELLAAQR